MKAVRIADLKSRLSQHLRQVRAGQVLTVLDRDTPVARLAPIEEGHDLVVTRPAADAPPLRRVKLPPPTKLSGDVVAVLLADRRKRG
jgi:antitoxin (DNA-binding transcriptional repressor) of toxin-antitoxin stability system